MNQETTTPSKSSIHPLKVLIVIPARLAATRLPNKMLADINGIPMIVRVWQQAIKADIGPVIVACCGPEIKKAIDAVGGIAIETDPNLSNGTDRVMEAVRKFDPNGIYQIVVNVQGDLPTIDPDIIRAAILPLETPGADMASLCAVIRNPEELNNPNVPKVATGAWEKRGEGLISRAIYFSRQSIPANAKDHYHHIGIYAFRRSTLEAYTALAPSYLEQTEKLEQLRALEAGMRIDMTLVDNIPQSVDTPEDLVKVRELIG